MRLLAITLFALSLLILCAHADEAAPAEPPPFAVAELAGLFSVDGIPDRIKYMADLNSGDQYVPYLRVWGGRCKVLVGGEPVEATINVFVHESKVVAVKLEQLSADYSKAKQPQAQYEALRDELAATLKPDDGAQLGDSTAFWTHAKQLNAEVSRGYDSQGMFFFVVDRDSQPVVTQFWQKWNAAIEEAASGFMFGF